MDSNSDLERLYDRYDSSHDPLHKKRIRNKMGHLNMQIFERHLDEAQVIHKDRFTYEKLKLNFLEAREEYRRTVISYDKIRYLETKLIPVATAFFGQDHPDVLDLQEILYNSKISYYS